MFRLLGTTALVSAAILTTAASAAAADFYVPAPAVAAPAPTAAAPSWDISFGGLITNNYVSRGLSQTDGDAAVQVFSEFTTGILYAGMFASNVNYTSVGGGPGVEFDLSIGIRPTLGMLNLDLGYVHYLYTNGAAADYGELFAKASAAIAEPVTIGGAVFFAPDYGRTGFSAIYAEANAALVLPIAAGLWSTSVTGAVGYQSFDNPAAVDYVTWNAGATFTYAETISLDLRYHDTNISEPLFTASLGFKSALSRLSGWAGGM